MARRVVNRKELRAQVEAAESAGIEKQAPKKAKTPSRRKSRAKEPVEENKKVFWGVFNQSLKRVALYDFSQKKQAEKKAEELSKDGKSPHFVQKVKEVIER